MDRAGALACIWLGCAGAIGCGSANAAQSPASPPKAADAIDALPAGPLVVTSASERNESESIDEVAFRDARGAAHTLRVAFRSYPIVVTGVTLDDRDVPPGPSSVHLAQRLADAGLANNTPILLRAFGGPPSPPNEPR